MAVRISDVAQRAGVSLNTVSRVTNGADNVSPEIRERVEQAIRELGYVPNLAARSLRSRRTQWLTLVVPDITNQHWHVLARGVEDTANQRGYTVFLCNTDDTVAKERRYLEVAASQNVAGVIIVASHPDARHLAAVRQANIPTVCINRRVVGWATDTVYADMTSAAYALTRHLLGLGHRRVALLSGPTYHSGVQDRLLGYRLALAESSIPFDHRLHLFDGFTVASGEALTERVLDEHLGVTAIFAANPILAAGAIDALNRRGMRIPEDIALVCFGDVEQPYYPYLTCILEPAYLMGATAADLLFSRIESPEDLPPRQVVLPTKLVLHYSCGRALGRPDLPQVSLVLPPFTTEEPISVLPLPEERRQQLISAAGASTDWSQDDDRLSLGRRSNAGRVVTALRGGATDRLPHVMTWTPTEGLIASLQDSAAEGARTTDVPATPERHIALAEEMGIDAVVCRFERSLKPGSVTRWGDLDQLSQPAHDEIIHSLDRYARAAEGVGVGLGLEIPALINQAASAVQLAADRPPAEGRQLLQTLLEMVVGEQAGALRRLCERFAERLSFIMLDDRPSRAAKTPPPEYSELFAAQTRRLVDASHEFDLPVILRVSTEGLRMASEYARLGVDTLFPQAIDPDAYFHAIVRWGVKMAYVVTIEEVGDPNGCLSLAGIPGCVATTPEPASSGFTAADFVAASTAVRECGLAFLRGGSAFADGTPGA